MKAYLRIFQVVAGSQEAGQDYEHVQMLIERFQQFARDTESIGLERVTAANSACDQVSFLLSIISLLFLFLFN